MEEEESRRCIKFKLKKYQKAAVFTTSSQSPPLDEYQEDHVYYIHI